MDSINSALQRNSEGAGNERGRTLMYIIIIAIILLAGVLWSGIKLHTGIIRDTVAEREKQLTEAYSLAISDLNRIIAEKDASLRASEKRHAKLKELIKQKAEEAEAIKPPKGVEDVVKRFNSIGYHPVVRH
jgi:predicted Holliday junction resolvase-like endonuclease